jgi:integrase
MAKRVRDSGLESRATRGKLKPRGKPYYKSIGEGLHLGYRKGRVEGKWVVRRYAGHQAYITDTIGTADDIADADGTVVLNFWQAQEKAREIGGKLVYAGPYRVQDAIADYLTFLGDRGWEIEYRIRKHILPKLGDQMVDQLTSETLRAWHNSMVRIGDDPEIERKSKCSANRMLATLKSALNLAFREGKVSNDVAWRRVQLFKNVIRARTRYLSLAECERLINACDPQFRLLVRGALETGARYSELCRMVCGDFNPDAGTAHMLQSKSGRERYIILTDDGAAFFSQLTAGKSGNAPMFGKDWRRDHQARPMRLACQHGRIDPPVGFHQLRHTWASHAVMAGMPLNVVARNLGHVDTKMVEKHYGHLAASYVADPGAQVRPALRQCGVQRKGHSLTVHRDMGNALSAAKFVNCVGWVVTQRRPFLAAPEVNSDARVAKKGVARSYPCPSRPFQ